jgi:hypothetical protein
LQDLHRIIVPEEQGKTLSSLELLLMGLNHPPATGEPPLRMGSICPTCKKGELDYNGLLQLECPLCGFVSGEGGGCT